MKNIFITLLIVVSYATSAEVYLYLPVDGLRTPSTPAQIRLSGGHTRALHDLLPYDPVSGDKKLRIMTLGGPLAVISCERDNCVIAFGAETSEHDFWPLERLDMGGAYAGPSPIATVATLDPGSFPENGEIVFWGGRTSYLSANLPGPVTFQGPQWNLTLSCHTRQDSVCKLVLKKR
jgi:hypothetical protein